jgi:CDP-diacylglycerol--glycerol-3-phosphate 3-phosphatidyltransferase
MFSRRIQQRARYVVILLIQPLARLGVSPNLLTSIGLLLSIVTALVIAQGYLFAGGLLVVFAGIFDMFDGAMARVRNAATTFGAFLDSTLDRYSESIILFGLLWYTLQHPGLQDLLWPAPHEQTWMITLIFVSVVGSLMVSYTKARAEGLGIECKSGLLARPERVIILAIGLLSNTSIWALAILAVFSNITALERMISVWRSTRQSVETRDQVYCEQHDASANDHYLPNAVGTNEVHQNNVRPVPTGMPPFIGDVQQEETQRHTTKKT